MLVESMLLGREYDEMNWAILGSVFAGVHVP
jgi:hypothetical protein